MSKETSKKLFTSNEIETKVKNIISYTNVEKSDTYVYFTFERNDSKYELGIYDNSFGESISYSIWDEYNNNLKQYMCATQSAPLGYARSYGFNELDALIADVKADIEKLG